MHPEFGVKVLWGVTIGFLCGIALRSLFAVPESFAVFLIVIASALFVVAGNSIHSAARYTVFFAIIAGALGIVRMERVILKEDAQLSRVVGAGIELIGRVSAEPDIRDSNVRVVMDRSSFASSSKPINARVLVLLPARSEVSYGEIIKLRGNMMFPSTFEGTSGRTFDYPGYLAAQGIGYELGRAEVLDRQGNAGNVFIAEAYRIKRAVITGLERALSEPHAGLASGITVGDKRGLGKELTEEFRTVSLVHIIVLSGYNISIVITYLFSVLLLLRAPPWLRFSGGAVVALFFAVMTGFASASLRASLMALIAISGQLSNRIYKPERALALVACAMVAWNPYLLIFDPGFQLSFLATGGLILFSPMFEHMFANVPRSYALRDTLVATSSAQISVLPLLLYQGGTLSIVGLFANILVLPVVPLAMLFSMIGSLAGLMIPVSAPFVGFPAYLFLSYILYVTHLLSSIPFASVLIPAFSAWVLVPVYAGLFMLGMRASQNETAPKKGAAK